VLVVHNLKYSATRSKSRDGYKIATYHIVPCVLLQQSDLLLPHTASTFLGVNVQSSSHTLALTSLTPTPVSFSLWCPPAINSIHIFCLFSIQQGHSPRSRESKGACTEKGVKRGRPQVIILSSKSSAGASTRASLQWPWFLPCFRHVPLWHSLSLPSPRRVSPATLICSRTSASPISHQVSCCSYLNREQ
jgi:hypothetical protein